MHFLNRNTDVRKAAGTGQVSFSYTDSLVLLGEDRGTYHSDNEKGGWEFAPKNASG